MRKQLEEKELRNKIAQQGQNPSMIELKELKIDEQKEEIIGNSKIVCIDVDEQDRPVIRKPLTSWDVQLDSGANKIQSTE